MNFITNYWSEATLILFVIIAGAKYLIKTYFDLSIKKTEIIFDKVKQQKLIELKNFFTCFNDLNSSLIVYSAMVNQNDKKFSSQIENKLSDDWTSFKTSILYIKLFLSNEEIKIINELDNELLEVNRTLRFYGFDDPTTFKGEDYETRIKKLREIRDTTFKKKIPKIIEQLIDNLRADFRVNK
jgi:hypothetical protein